VRHRSLSFFQIVNVWVNIFECKPSVLSNPTRVFIE